MRVIGIKCTSAHVYVADHRGNAKEIPRSVGRLAVSSTDWLALEQCVATQFQDLVTDGLIDSVAILRCSSGQHGSSVEAIKAEGVVELVAARRGHKVVLVAPQSLKKALGCPKDKHWQDMATELFNSDGTVKYFAVGMNGAMAAAFKVVCTAKG